jgi:hypothetical protein
MTSIILEDNFVAVKGVMKLRANLLFAWRKKEAKKTRIKFSGHWTFQYKGTPQRLSVSCPRIAYIRFVWRSE